MIVARLTLTPAALSRASESEDFEVRIAASALAMCEPGMKVEATINEDGVWTVVSQRTAEGPIERDAAAWLNLWFGSDATWHGYHPRGRAAGAAVRAADLLGGTIAYDAGFLKDADGETQLPPGAVY